MADSDIEMWFPRVPRKFSNDFLDPMLVEEDFDDTVGMARRFAREHPEFTEEDLINRLVKNGVKLYGTREEWEGFFTDIREEITIEAANKKPPEEISWIVQHVGGIATYTMVEVLPAVAVTVEVVTEDIEPESVIRKPESHREIAPVPTDVMCAMLEVAPDGMMRPKDFADMLTKRLRLDPAATAEVIDAALAAKTIKKVGSRGTTYIAVNVGEAEKKRPVVQPGAEELEERLLDEGELKMVIAILDKLAEGHVTTGVTTKNLESLLHSSYTRDHFRRLLRILDSQRLIKIDSQANYRQARKSPRVHLRGQDTKNRWQANREGYINRLKQTKIRLKSDT
jgi:hypothetical protein